MGRNRSETASIYYGSLVKSLCIYRYRTHIVYDKAHNTKYPEYKYGNCRFAATEQHKNNAILLEKTMRLVRIDIRPMYKDLIATCLPCRLLQAAPTLCSLMSTPNFHINHIRMFDRFKF